MRRRVLPLNDFEVGRPATSAISASITPQPIACCPTPIQNGLRVNCRITPPMVLSAPHSNRRRMMVCVKVAGEFMRLSFR